jgi:hypothetical protein
MTEQQQTTQSPVEDTVNAAVDQASDAAQAAVAHGRQVAALWLGVSRTAVDAAAKTLTATSELISSVAQSMGKLSDRIDDASKRA